ncbi:MAG: AI-2E family transporter [Pseudomonadota bacterium]|nr:AI-2E family transporter [Pseudomonadota bacterium]
MPVPDYRDPGDRAIQPAAPPHSDISAEPLASDLAVTPPALPQLPLHVHAKGLSLGILATVALVFALQWAEKFLVPLLLGIFIAYTLNPLVAFLERWRVKRVIGATLVTVIIVAGLAMLAQRLQGEVLSIVEELPALTHKVTKLITDNTDGSPSTIQQIQKAAAEVEQATANATAAPGADKRLVTRRPIQNPAGSNFKVMDWVLAGSMGIATFLSQATMVIFLVFFLLLSGNTFKRKLVKLTPSLKRKKVTVHILEDINTSIQKYMFMLLVTNTLLALLMWVALRAIGLENAGAWAIFSGLAHVMPYFGPLLITAATGTVAFLQFESVRMVVLVAGMSMAVATLVGMVVTTWMTGKFAKMNPAAVFVSLLFWGWLWGMWGLLLGVPVVVVLKVVAERIEGMEVVAELLGE